MFEYIAKRANKEICNFLNQRYIVRVVWLTFITMICRSYIEYVAAGYARF